MVFSSTYFLLSFLAIFLIVYQFINPKYKNYTILIASIYFYSWGAPVFVYLLLASTIIDFYLVAAMHCAQSIRSKKGLLILSVSLNLGLLFYFKYFNFFIDNFNIVLSKFGVENLTWTEIILPIGISFYTFQTLTYSIDVYRHVHKPLTKLTDYLLYIMSFPQMIAGPIVRFNEIADQITSREERTEDKIYGFFRLAIGLGKKVLIANVLGHQADLIMSLDPNSLGMLTAWIGILAYSFQIYFDFAGYSDMAIGLGQMIGFRFPENFDNPYTARNITEFWRKWHITLGRFMKNYLYIPLGGNRVGKYRMFFNLWLVFLLSGLWHGASWNFVIWGAFHGFFLILDRLFLKKLLDKLGKIPSILFTFFIVMIAWLFFRLEHFWQVKAYLKSMFGFNNGNYITEWDLSFKFTMILAIIFSFFTIFKFGQKINDWVYTPTDPTKKWYFSMFAVCVLLYVLALASLATEDFNPFIYFRF